MPVDFRGWVEESTRRISNEPLWGIPRSLYYPYVGLFLSMSRWYPIGTNIFKSDWDVLVVLDCCRVDAAQAVADEYDFINDVESTKSVGSTSMEWLVNTFRRRFADEIRNTAYVSGNPYITPVFRERKVPPGKLSIPFGPKEYNVVNPNEFAYLDEVREYGIDEETRAVHPRTMTDRAVSVAREHDPERMIVHYMQPHAPHIGEKHGLGANIFPRLQNGEITEDEAWQSYMENLRLVLDELSLLLENLDASRVAITADHGEAFGEYGFYAHPIACPLPAVRRVPWIETTATDTKSYTPDIDPEEHASETVSLNQHLEDLGYL